MLSTYFDKGGSKLWQYLRIAIVDILGKFITPSIHLSVRHDARETARRAGLSGVQTVYSRHLWGEFPPQKKLTIPPQMAAKLCSKSFFRPGQ